MLKKLLIALSWALLLAWDVHAGGHGRAPRLSQEHRERALEMMCAYQPAPLDPAAMVQPDPALHGWWKAVTRGDLGGFGFNALTDDIDVYIYIDVEPFSADWPHVWIKTICGTPDYPRECSALDVAGQIATNLYFAPTPTELVHVMDRDGPLFEPTLKQSWWSLRLQPDGKTLCASSDSQPHFAGYGATHLLFEKVDAPILPSTHEAIKDPVEMAKYIRNMLLTQYNQAQNSHFEDGDYLPYKVQEALFQQMLTTGITFESKIREIRTSVKGVHDRQEFGSFTSNDLVTDIFTDEFSYATIGSTVEIVGCTGGWAALNGTYVNGVAIDEDGGIPNPSRLHVDTSSKYKPNAGTFRNVYNHFLLRFDSSDASRFPRDELGFAQDLFAQDLPTQALEGDPQVRVTHRFSSDMEYPAFFAAVRALFFLFYKVSQHNGQVGFFKPGSMFLIDSWQELERALKSDTFWGSHAFAGNALFGTRTSQKVPSGFYNNPVMAERGVVTYNDPFGLSQQPGSYYDYNIVLANYIVSPKNLYWAIKGIPLCPYQFDPTKVGYKPPVPEDLCAHFTGLLGDLEVVDGKPVPHNPDPAHYTIFGCEAGISDVRDANAYYIGTIDPQLTQGKKVGYLRWLDEDAMDPHSYLCTSTFAPDVDPTVKYGREAMTYLFTSLTRYFQTELDADAVIIDIRSYNGGYGYSFTLAELFGDDRVAGETLWTKKGLDHLEPVNLADASKYSFYNNIAAEDAASTSRFFVQQNEANYGLGAVFRGNLERPKKVIILTDNAACSMGDAFSHYFMGEKLDGDLGSNTLCRIIGDIDGRLKGAASYANPLPISHAPFSDASGNPLSPIYIRADFACGQPLNGITGIPFNHQSEHIKPSHAPTLRGKAGRAPLINDWEHTVWRDLGLIKPSKGHFSLHIPKRKPRFEDRSSWRDCWLEQAILAAIEAEQD